MAVSADAYLLIQAVVDQFHPAAANWTLGDFARGVVSGWGSHRPKFRDIAITTQAKYKHKLVCINDLARLFDWCGREDSNLHPVARTSS